MRLIGVYSCSKTILYSLLDFGKPLSTVTMILLYRSKPVREISHCLLFFDKTHPLPFPHMRR